MPKNDPAYKRAYYADNAETIKAGVKERRARIFQYIREYKESRGCMDCGGTFPYYQLDLDHRPGFEKLSDPSRMATRGWGFEKINTELDKCDVVCRNCHAERTHIRKVASSEDV